MIKQILRFSDVFRRFPVALAEGPDHDVNAAVVRDWFERLQRSSSVMNRRKFSLKFDLAAEQFGRFQTYKRTVSAQVQSIGGHFGRGLHC